MEGLLTYPVRYDGNEEKNWLGFQCKLAWTNYPGNAYIQFDSKQFLYYYKKIL